VNSKPSPSPFVLLGMGVSIATCVAFWMAAGYILGNVIGASALCIFAGLAIGLLCAVATVRAEFKRYM
jgi:hypothetical protein